MLDVAFMALHVGQLSSRQDMEWCFDAVTQNSAKIIALDEYGIEKGKPANFVLLQAKDKIEAIRLRAHRLLVVRNGRIISRSNPIEHTLYKPDGKTVFNELN
jgi:cytosine deaminase